MSAILDHDPRRGRWIPWVFVGGMLLVLVVNIGMVVSAITTFTGVTVGHSYDRGRAYNHVLAEAARQDALGWQASVAVQGATLRITVQDRAAAGVAGTLAGVLRRPLEGTDLPLALTAAGPGRWEAALPALAPGQWEVRATLTDAAGQRLDIRERVVLR
jgi:nitrogen fixation protein FixH